MTGRLILILAAMAAVQSVAFCVYGADVPAVIERSDAVFDMKSPVSGTYTVSRKVLVSEPAGKDAAVFVNYNDSFRSLSSFSAKVIYNGKAVKKAGMRDLVWEKVSASLADDSSYAVYVPDCPYPFSVEYEYTVTYRDGIVSFPSFFPLSVPGVPLMDASYMLNVPAGTDISYWSWSEPEVTRGDKTDSYFWKASLPDGFTEEHMMPELREILPVVYACPVDFIYAGTTGSQKTWKDFGAWLYGLQKGCYELDEGLRSSIAEMVSGTTDERERVRLVYDYLRRNTRYVSIQLGIGGLRPFPAQTVADTGFGDCKALSVFMSALLGCAGVESFYAIVNTEERKLLDGFTSAGQMNHAMLCVPVQGDTLWIECTNPKYPLGYRHSGIAGHEAVLVKDSGGELVKVGPYRSEDRIESRNMTVRLNMDGSAECDVWFGFRQDMAEPFIGFAGIPDKARRRMLTSGLRFQLSGFNVESFSDNFGQLLEHPGLCPEFRVRCSMSTAGYATVSDRRIFVPLNPFPAVLASYRSRRVNPICIEDDLRVYDTVRVKLPEGYVLEGVREYSPVSSPFGDFSTEVTYDGKDVLVIQKLEIHACRYGKEMYGAFRDFAAAVTSGYSGSFVAAPRPDSRSGQ